MEDKLNLHTIFRTLIPGYVFILVVYSLKFCLDKNVPSKEIVTFLVFLGFPIGVIFQFHYRIVYFLCCFYGGINNKISQYITKKIGKSAEYDSRSNNFVYKNFCYSATVHYYLETHKELKKFHSTLVFNFTQMHAYGTTALAIMWGLIFCIIFFSKNTNNDFVILVHLWVFFVVLLFLLYRKMLEIIVWWHRVIIDQNWPQLKILFKKTIFE